jgi:hypothetical protein
MQAITIGLPTVLRQFSIAWLSSKADAGMIARIEQQKAATPVRAIVFMIRAPSDGYVVTSLRHEKTIELIN